MIKYEVYEGVFDMDFPDTSATIIDATEKGRLRNIINNLNMYADNMKIVTEIYTNVLLDQNVSYFLPKITQQDVFMRHFPELYEYNEYGENLFNCEQNSKYHRYSVFYHIVASIENANVSEIPIADWQKKVIKWTMFLHDIGKPYVKKVAEDGTETFIGHDEKSIDLAQKILSRFDFTENEKNIIYTLIKYHDKYLTAEEVTQENLTFLANELGNDRELFYLLINVKDADAKAKSTEVYNDFKIIKEKFYDFANTYFAKENRQNLEVKSVNAKNVSEEVEETATEEKLSRVAKLRRLIASDRDAMNALIGFASGIERRLSAIIDGPKAEAHKDALVPIYVLLFQLHVPKTITVEVYNVLADAVNAALPKPAPKLTPKPKEEKPKEEVKETKRPAQPMKKWGIIKQHEVKSVDAIREEIQASRHSRVF